MRLLCTIGFHTAAPGARWNAGFCFGRCRHCGRDLVRAPQDRWRVPKGYRVVWKTRAEADDFAYVGPRTLLAVSPPPPDPEPRLELPIQAVLRRLDPDFMDGEEAMAADVARKLHVQQALKRSLASDFMDEEVPMLTQRRPGMDDGGADEPAVSGDRPSNAGGASY